MTTQNPSNIHSTSMNKRMIQGAVPALIIMIIFLTGVDNPDPSWGTYWWIRPLLVISFAGAMGGVCYYFMDHFRVLGGWQKIAANIVSGIVYIIGLWMGSVLGLVGTLWN